MTREEEEEDRPTSYRIGPVSDYAWLVKVFGPNDFSSHPASSPIDPWMPARAGSFSPTGGLVARSRS